MNVHGNIGSLIVIYFKAFIQRTWFVSWRERSSMLKRTVEDVTTVECGCAGKILKKKRYQCPLLLFIGFRIIHSSFRCKEKERRNVTKFVAKISRPGIEPGTD